MQNVADFAPTPRLSAEIHVTREGSRRQSWAPPFVLATHDGGTAMQAE